MRYPFRLERGEGRGEVSNSFALMPERRRRGKIIAQGKRDEVRAALGCRPLQKIFKPCRGGTQFGSLDSKRI